MKTCNEILIEMDSVSQNESFARVAVSAFVAALDPPVNEVIDLRTAVSEAVTNAIIHGYENKPGKVYIKMTLTQNSVTIAVKDHGTGIADIAQAREALYTSKPELERSGLGFSVMEGVMDDVAVHSEIGKGTEVMMTKTLTRP